MEPINFRKYRRKKKSRSNLILNIILCMISLVALTGCLLLLMENYRLKDQAVAAMATLDESGTPATGEADPAGSQSAGGNGQAGGGQSADGNGQANGDGRPADGNGQTNGGASVGGSNQAGGQTGGGAQAVSGKAYTEAEVNEISSALAEQAAADAAGQFLHSLKEQVVGGEDLSAILRAFYTDELVVAAEGEYHFFPISEVLKKHSYEKDLFITDENEVLTYQDAAGNVLSRKGIDVSRFQGEIDWSLVAADGVEFAMIRLGIRGSAEEGKLVLDPTYETNITEAAANGIETGVYFYTQATNETEALEEADFVLENLEGRPLTWPVVLDIEAIETSAPRTADMTKEEWTKVTVTFCERIKAAGYRPMIYGNLRSFLLMLDMEQLEEYEKWFAFFRTPLYFPYEHSIWQYSDSGQVDGINGPVDLNISMKDLSAHNE